ncbi:MAG: glycosyltransferase family 9 protein [Helicobacteraceae bacterium]|jgi:ADP-heptose:LPS heptosyltransferase|nr:glycosyltransferase family 9 protein [Helicobacteraceae bacterium]
MTVIAIRLSSLGDIAIMIAPLYSVARRYHGDRFFAVVKEPFAKLFINKPENLFVIAARTEDRHRGFFGILRLFFDIKKSFEGKALIADLHGSVRSKILSLLFRLTGAKTASINKARSEKKALTRMKKKLLKPLKTTLERYQDVFTALDYDASLKFTSIFEGKNAHSGIWIGIAPFAKHIGKTYPPDLMRKVIETLSRRSDVKLFLLGGANERGILQEWEKTYANTQSTAGKLSFDDEMRLICDLDLMITMDSANLHLASLTATTAVSIWGATHPFAGFYGFNQSMQNAIGLPLSCRPCAIYGQKRCFKGSYECMKLIDPLVIVDRVLKNIARPPIQ